MGIFVDKNNRNDFPGEYDPDTEKYRIYSEQQSTESITTLIVKAVATLRDTPSTELDPIYETINSEALNNIFAPECHSGGFDDHVEFTYGHCRVTVFCTGLIEIDPESEL